VTQAAKTLGVTRQALFNMAKGRNADGLARETTAAWPTVDSWVGARRVPTGRRQIMPGSAEVCRTIRGAPSALNHPQGMTLRDIFFLARQFEQNTFGRGAAHKLDVARG
jgi:hypothetical protein